MGSWFWDRKNEGKVRDLLGERNELVEERGGNEMVGWWRRGRDYEIGRRRNE